jgi:hypothetical protein
MTCERCKKEITPEQQKKGYFPKQVAWVLGTSVPHNALHRECNYLLPLLLRAGAILK